MYIGWKKIMIMIVFLTLCTWFFYLTLSENFWKFKIQKNHVASVKKKPMHLLKKSCIKCDFCLIFPLWAPILLVKKYHIFLPNTGRFLGEVFCLGGCFLFITGGYQMTKPNPWNFTRGPKCAPLLNSKKIT